MQEKQQFLKVVKNHQKEHQADCAKKLKTIFELMATETLMPGRLKISYNIQHS